MNTPLALDTYVAIIEAGSLSEASRVLGEPRATLSRRLAQLEEHFGVRLVHRSTRRFEPTRTGLELYRRGRRIVDEVRAAEAALVRKDGVPRGPLRVSLPSAAPMFPELITRFCERFPEVQPDVWVTDRHLDLVAEGVDVAIRAGVVDDPSLIRRTLVRHRLVLVGAPAYLARRGAPRTVDDLDHHEFVVGYGGMDRPSRTIRLRGGGELAVTSVAACNEISIQLALVVAGRGLAVLPDVIAERAIEAGRLVVLLPDEVGLDVSASLVYPERGLLEPAVEAFVAHTIAFFEGRSVAEDCRRAAEG